MPCEKKMEETKTEKKFTLLRLISHLTDDVRKDLLAGELTLIVSWECRIGGFIDNNSRQMHLKASVMNFL